MKRKAPCVRKTFQDGGAVPIRECNLFAFSVHWSRSEFTVFGRKLLQRNAAAFTPASHQRLDRSAILTLVKEISCLLSLPNVHFDQKSVLRNRNMLWRIAVKRPLHLFKTFHFTNRNITAFVYTCRLQDGH
ncbi:hypothetical protein D3C77_501140 [compost metagenome]